MKKHLSLLALLCMLWFYSTAQTNADEAKGAYLLAEESYGKGDYKSALEFLLQAREALGGGNCKVIYLQVMATREQYAKDTGLNTRLLPLILEFEKSPDYADFNEEKKMEITKIKLTVKKEMKAAQEKADAEAKGKEEERRRKAEREKAVSDIANQWAPLAITPDELDRLKPDWKVKEWKVSSWSKEFDVLHPSAFSYSKSSYPFAQSKDKDADTAQVANMILYKGKITCYCRYLIDFDGGARHDDGTGYAEALKAMNRATALVTENTGIKPGGFPEAQYGGYTNKTSEWHTDNYFINDIIRFKTKGSSGIVQMVRCVTKNNPAQ